MEASVGSLAMKAGEMMGKSDSKTSRTLPGLSFNERSYRKRVNFLMSNTVYGSYWETVQVIITVFSIVTYVRSTYDVADSVGLRVTEIVVYVLFLLDYLIRWFAASDRISYPFSAMAVVDAVTLVPVFTDLLLSSTGGGSTFDAASLRFFRVLRVLRVLRLLRASGMRGLSVFHRTLMRLCVTMICIFFIAASLIMIAETDYFEYQMGKARRTYEEGVWQQATFGNFLYMLLVTMSSVGYGDMLVFSYAGRALIAIFIVCIIVVLPVQLAIFSVLNSSQSKFRTSYKRKANSPQHIIILGDVGRHSVMTISEILHEFYHEDRFGTIDDSDTDEDDPLPPVHSSSQSAGAVHHSKVKTIAAAAKRVMLQAGRQHRRAPLSDPGRFISEESVVIIMGMREPDEELRTLITEPQYNEKVSFILRSPFDAGDLHSVDAAEAAAIFVMSNEKSVSDSSIALLLVSLRASVPHVPTYICSRSPMCYKYSYSLEGGIVPCAMSEIRSSMMAISSRIPGSSSLLTNLMRGSLLPNNVLNNFSQDILPWELEYAMGTRATVQTVHAPSSLAGYPFTDVAKSIYSISAGRCIVIGVKEMPAARGTREADERLKRLRQAIDSGCLHVSEEMRLSMILSPLAEAMGAPVPGELLLNPGSQYGLSSGQLLYVISQEVHASSFFSAGKVEAASLQLGLNLNAQGRDDASGFPASSSIDEASMSVRVPSSQSEKNGGGMTPRSAAADASRPVAAPVPVASWHQDRMLQESAMHALQGALSSRHLVANKVRDIAVATRKPNFGCAAGGNGPTEGGVWEPWKPSLIFNSDFGFDGIPPNLASRAEKSLFVSDVRSINVMVHRHVIISCSVVDIPLAVRPYRLRMSLAHNGFPKISAASLKELVAARLSESMGDANSAPTESSREEDEPILVLIIDHSHGGRMSPQLAVWLLSVGGVYIMESAVVTQEENLMRAGVESAKSIVLFSRDNIVDDDDDTNEGSDIIFSYRSLQHCLRDVSTSSDFCIIVNIPRITDIAPLELSQQQSEERKRQYTSESFNSTSSPQSRSFSRSSRIAPTPLVVVQPAAADLKAQAAVAPAHRSHTSKRLVAIAGPCTWSYFSPLYVSGGAIASGTLYTIMMAHFFNASSVHTVNAILNPWQYYHCIVEKDKRDKRLLAEEKSAAKLQSQINLTLAAEKEKEAQLSKIFARAGIKGAEGKIEKKKNSSQWESLRDRKRSNDAARAAVSAFTVNMESNITREERKKTWGGSALFLEPVPHIYHRQIFGRLSSDMLNSRGVVVIGLLRSRHAISGASGGAIPPAPADYVFTCPDMSTSLWSPSALDDNSYDRMYILSR
jgi:voltage-gated potassium channel